MAVWLDAAELHRLTGKVRYKAQCRVLTALGIPFDLAASGEPLVRTDYARLDAKAKPERNRGPNWDRIGA